jgi:hypothetical protein
MTVPVVEDPMYVTGSGRWRPVVPRHRRGSRLASHLGSVVLLVAVVAAGAALTAHLPDADTQQRPFASRGTVGEVVPARDFDATVLGVRTAAVLTSRPGWRHDTGGVWVLVHVRLRAARATRTVAYAAVRDAAGRTYEATGRVGQPLLDRPLQPGLPVTGEIAFEVPRAAATGLVLQLATPAYDLRMTAMAEVPLPIDAALVAQGAALAEPVAVAGAGGAG